MPIPDSLQSYVETYTCADHDSGLFGGHRRRNSALTADAWRKTIKEIQKKIIDRKCQSLLQESEWAL